MASNRLRRIAKELADIQSDTDSKIFAEAADGSDLSHLHASFPGPPDTPYEGGTYIVDIKIPQEYPFRPPQMFFKTKLWHPNVSSQTVSIFPPDHMQSSDKFQGAICLDTLGSAWSPVLTIKSALLSLQSLLSTPEPKDPQDAEVASMLMKNPEQFQRVAREWAIKHAGAPKTTNWESIIAQRPTQSKPKSQKTLSREEELRQQMLRYGLSLLPATFC
jgi:ubiquitin-conjugating enzyme (huntingtin interacting protein 2)